LPKISRLRRETLLFGHRTVSRFDGARVTMAHSPSNTPGTLKIDPSPVVAIENESPARSLEPSWIIEGVYGRVAAATPYQENDWGGVLKIDDHASVLVVSEMAICCHVCGPSEAGVVGMEIIAQTRVPVSHDSIFKSLLNCRKRSRIPRMPTPEPSD
jgi:hypothetical protein